MVSPFVATKTSCNRDRRFTKRFASPLNFRNVLAGQDQAFRGLGTKLCNKIEIALFDSALLTACADVFGQRVHNNLSQSLELQELRFL